MRYASGEQISKHPPRWISSGSEVIVGRWPLNRYGGLKTSMVLLCQPHDITSPVGKSTACEWYFRSLGCSSISDHTLVTGSNIQLGSPAGAPPDRKTVPSGNNTGLGLTREVGSTWPVAIGSGNVGPHVGDKVERLMI